MIKLFIIVASFFIQFKPIEVVNTDSLLAKMDDDTDVLYVVNFWATWCKPCVAEMPFFETIQKKYQKKLVKVIFVSLDFLKEKERVEKFVIDKEITSEVCLLSAGNPNDWINKIDSSWSGAIPATVFYKKNKKTYFREGDFTQRELDSIIINHFKNP